MGRYSIRVGEQEYASKASALEFYKRILDSYQVGDELSAQDARSVIELALRGVKPSINQPSCTQDARSVIELAFREWSAEDIEAYKIETGGRCMSVVVDYHPQFKSTKCFFLVEDSGDMRAFSYRLAVTGGLSADQVFSRTCREVVAARLREFKKQQFSRRPVRCAVTNAIVEWEQCQIDHKAPLTFSVIVRSFIVANSIDTAAVSYVDKSAKPRFASVALAAKFDDFHRNMAVLRIVSTSQNASTSSAGRIKPTKKDQTL